MMKQLKQIMQKVAVAMLLVFGGVLFQTASTAHAQEGTLVNHSGTWYHTNNGQRTNYTGLTQYNGTWYYVQNGRLDWGVTTLVQYNGTWYYVENSQITWGTTTLTQFHGTWYYVENAQIIWGTNTLFQYHGTWYAIRNAQIDWSFEGMVEYHGTTYYLKDAQITWGKHGVVSLENKLYYLNNTAWDKQYNGFQTFNNTLVYFKDGLVDWTYSEKTPRTYNGQSYVVKNNKAVLRGRTTQTVTQTNVTDAFKTITREDETLEKGVEREDVRGVNGTETKTYLVTYEDGEEVSRVLQKTQRTPRTDRVIRVGVRETKTETRVVTTAFTKTSTPSEDVPRGVTEIVTPGRNGEVEEVYTVVYVKGVKKSEVRTSVRQRQTVVNQVERTGTGIQTYLQKWDYIAGKYVLSKETDKSLDTIAELNRSNAKTDHTLYSRTYSGGRSSYKPVYTPVEMTEIMEKYLDVQAFNNEFLKLVNAHRQAHNMKTMYQVDAMAVQAAMIRSKEQAAIGDLRSNGQSHTRPDGTKWTTVANEIAGYSRGPVRFTGENILARGETNVYFLTNEAELARVAFEQWKASDGHNAQMLSTGHTHFGVGVGFTTTELTSGKYPIIATTIFATKKP